MKKKQKQKQKQNKKQCLEGQLNRVHPLSICMQSRFIDYTPHRQISIGQVELLSVFKAFSREILLVDAVCSGEVVLINKFKGIFEENKQCFDVKSGNLTHFIAFGE